LFNWLFDEIEKIERTLKRKKGKEEAELLQALMTAKEKLIIYYGKTSDIYDCFFNLATILDLSIWKTLYQVCFSYRFIIIIYHRCITYSLL
jgi:hypothetical protein